jgi:hypothetical protein
MLENEEETRNTGKQIQELKRELAKHVSKYPMKTFNHTQGTGGTNDAKGNKRKRGDNAGGGNGGAGARDCAELGAHGYEVQPRVIVDENGIMEPFSNVRQPVSTYAPC